MNILSFLGGWQVKIVILIALLFGAWTWHRAEVKIAVKEAVSQIEAQQDKERLKLLDKANEESNKLKEQILKNKQEKDRELQAANTKYNSLVEWVRNLQSTTIPSDSTGDSRNSEARSEEVISELRRRHAIDLARLSYDAEEIKVHLEQCYRDYDAVKAARDKFVKDSTPKSP